MKRKLLFLAIILFVCISSFGQTVANQPPNLQQCKLITPGPDPVFDLTQQTPIILGNQDPQQYTVKYFHSFEGADTNVGAIANPNAVAGAVIPETKTYYARVTDNADDTYAVTSFTAQTIAIKFTEPVVIHCGSKPLYPLNIGNYYTGPNGTGEMIDISTQEYIVYENGAQFYAHAEVNGCVIDVPFTVTFYEPPVINEPSDIYACDDDNDGVVMVDLNAIVAEITEGFEDLEVYFYHTLVEIENGDPAMWDPLGYAAPLNSTLWIQVVNAFCSTVTSIDIIETDCTDNQFSGTLTYDVYNNGCTENALPSINSKVYYKHNGNTYITFTDNQGNYSFENVPDGISNVTATNNVFISSPQHFQISMPSPGLDIDFCIAPLNPINDVAVSLFPNNFARPGQTASYSLICSNLGSYIDGGTVSLIFDDVRLDFLGANVPVVQSGNTLTFSNLNIYPYSSKSITVKFTVMIPPIADSGNILNFTSTIANAGNDIDMGNNSHIYSQMIVNSMDPNDITVREGEFITEEQADDYLNYTVRFQNMGTAEAIDVRVVYDLDDNLDWSTFEPVSASHAFKVIQKNDKVEIMFKDINLAFENEETGVVPASNGHIIYRVKPKTSVTLGDSMSAKADIYFDFNEPIITNTVTTTVQNVAGVNENSIDSFTVYPNPALSNVDLMVLNADSGFDVTIIDMLGKTVIKNSFVTNEASLDVSVLNSGIYFISITADGKQSTKKLIVK